MGSCFKVPIEKPTVDIDANGNEATCCNNDNCPSACCNFRIIIMKRSDNNLLRKTS